MKEEMQNSAACIFEKHYFTQCIGTFDGTHSGIVKAREIPACCIIRKLDTGVIFIFFVFLFNSLFTVHFSIVITTHLHRLTENFIIKTKI